MNYTVYRINRKSSTFGEQLDELRALKSVVSARIIANSSDDDDISVEVLTDVRITAKQELKVFDLATLGEVAAQMSEYVSSLNPDVTVKAINMLPIGRRAIGIAVTEVVPKEVRSDGVRKESPRKPNKKADAIPDAATKDEPV